MNKKQLIAKCKDLGIDISGLDTNAKLEAAIEAKEAELAKEETSEATEETSTETPENTEVENAQATQEASEATLEEKTTAFWKDERGRKWAFTEKAPKKMNIDGHSMTQAEILEDEEVIAELVYGNSSYLTQIHK